MARSRAASSFERFEVRITQQEHRMEQGSAMDIDLDALTVDAVQAGFRAGTFTAEQLTRACFDRIERDNVKYNALIFLNPDAIDDARRIDERRAAGESLGPLAGVPVVIKDPMDLV